jgi:hypothetical protein
MPTKNKAVNFNAVVLQPQDTKSRDEWGFILLPKKISSVLPRRGRTTVTVTINGHTVQKTLEPDGNLSHWFSIDAKLLDTAAINFGDEVEVRIEPLPREPSPKPPADFAKALAKHHAAKAVWDSTTSIAQVDWIHWIESGKLAKTRNERIHNACDMLESGKKRVCCFDQSGYYSKSLSAPKTASS